MTNVKLNNDHTAAVDQDYYWQPMDTAPRGVKIQLLTCYGVAIYGACRPGDPFFVGWAPCPKVPEWAKGMMR